MTIHNIGGFASIAYSKPLRLGGITRASMLAVLQEGSPIKISYMQEDTTAVRSYTTTLRKKYKVLPEEHFPIVQGSFVGKIKTTTIVDREGILYKNIGGDGSETPVQVGVIDYNKRELSIFDDDGGFASTTTNTSLEITHCVGEAPANVLSNILFRTPGSPIRNGSLTIKGELVDGTIISGTANYDGLISTDEMWGFVDAETGVCRVDFGEWVTNDSEAQAEPWWDEDNVSDDSSQVWKPYTVLADTILINCVITSYLPLDEDLLGLNPVRLPLDGKVPIFRDGDIAVIHNTKTDTMPTTLVAGDTFQISRFPVELVELYDQDGLFVPDTMYTVNTATGLVTLTASFNTSGFNLPLQALHRREDMVLISDVQITGHMAITNALQYDYEADESFISSVLPCGDLQARIYNEFTQESWTSVWSDSVIGSQTTAKFDLINYPITVVNRDAIKERFAIIFTSSSTFNVIGEHLGVIAQGNTSTNCSPINPATGNPYFTLNANGWGSGWASGDVFRFNSDAANYPYWFARTTLQGPETESSDFYTAQLRGDSS